MEAETMGRVTTEATFENIKDVLNAKAGTLSEDQVRCLDLTDALVDTGATLLSLPTRMIHQLGLERFSSKRILSSVGVTEVEVYSAVRLTIQGRTCTLDVVEVPDGVPPLIGQIPLENLDFVVDPASQKLIGNPAHGGIHTFELY